MNETLQEFVDSRGVRMRVDRQKGVIRGVKILGVESRNGRMYLPETLAEASPLYEETKVNVNHPKGNPAGARDYQDRIGVLRKVVVRSAEGLFADFHFNPKHALAEQLIWDAEHMPQNVGFSHNVQARTVRRGDRVVVEAITKVQSVDLVADPATTRGLFESTRDASEDSRDEADRPERGPGLAGLTVESVKRHRPDLVDALVGEQAAELGRLRAEIDRLEAAEALLRRRLAAHRLLREFNLPDPDLAEGWDKTVVSERFLESLAAAPNEETMRGMVEERARLVRGAEARGLEAGRAQARPRSRDQHQVAIAGPTDVKTFVKAIT
jgi:hypothetical protein